MEKVQLQAEIQEQIDLKRTRSNAREMTDAKERPIEREVERAINMGYLQHDASSATNEHEVKPHVLEEQEAEREAKIAIQNGWLQTQHINETTPQVQAEDAKPVIKQTKDEIDAEFDKAGPMPPPAFDNVKREVGEEGRASKRKMEENCKSPPKKHEPRALKPSIFMAHQAPQINPSKRIKQETTPVKPEQGWWD